MHIPWKNLNHLDSTISYKKTRNTCIHTKIDNIDQRYKYKNVSALETAKDLIDGTVSRFFSNFFLQDSGINALCSRTRTRHDDQRNINYFFRTFHTSDRMKCVQFIDSIKFKETTACILHTVLNPCI